MFSFRIRKCPNSTGLSKHLGDCCQAFCDRTHLNMRYLSSSIDAVSPRTKLFKHKLLMLTLALLVVATGMFATFMITPKYEATMSLLVSRDRIDPQITSTDKTAEITQTSISDEEFNSELELFKSLEVIKGAAQELDLVNDQKPKQNTWLADMRARLKGAIYSVTSKTDEHNINVSTNDQGYDFALEKVVNRVVGNLDVVPVKKSRVIKVSYVDTDPIRAKRTLDAIYRKFVDLHVQMNDKPEAGEVFNEQTGKFSDQLNAATRSLKDFDTSNGVVGADISTQQGLLQKQLSDTQIQLSSARTEIGETIKTISSLQEKIALEPKQIQTGFVSKYVPALDRMKDELLQLEQQRTQLLQKYQPNSRFVRENQERIDQLKKTLAAETANPPQERTYALNDLRRRLESQLVDAQTKLGSLKDREKTLSGQASKLLTDVEFLNTKSIERTAIERKRNISEEAYLLYQKKARENEIGQVLNKEQIMNFVVVDPPRTDGEQKNPKPLLNLVVLLAVGSMAAFAGSIAYDKFTSQETEPQMIVSALEFERRFDIPVLASISHFERSDYIEVRPKSYGSKLPPAVIEAGESGSI
ncbi:MAG: Wzz/FepE/Etk N-terminal domain-containing protein [Pyrinomonadaceae bacterium]